MGMSVIDQEAVIIWRATAAVNSGTEIVSSVAKFRDFAEF